MIALTPTQISESSSGLPNWSPWLIGMLLGIGVFVACRLLIRHHWKKVRQDPTAGEFTSVWTDVILRVVSYVGVFVFVLCVLGLAAMLFGSGNGSAPLPK